MCSVYHSVCHDTAYCGAATGSSRYILGPMLRRLAFLLLVLPAPAGAQITVSFPASVSSKPLDGRVLLLLSTDPSAEPRMQIDDSPRSQLVFGTTVDGLAPGQPVAITSAAAGYPIRSLSDLPPDDYYVQAVLNIY